MVYALAGGNTDYDPSLQGLTGTHFKGMDGDFLKVEVADTTPDDFRIVRKSHRHIGRPVSPDHVPTKLRRTGPPVSRAKLLDVNRQTGSLDLVNQTFKDIVEEFEPGIHQFFPVTYYNSKGTEVIGSGYYMIICKRLITLHDTLCIPALDEKGRYSLFDDNNEDPAYKNRDRSKDQIVFSTEKIGSHHMWHDRAVTSACLFSDALAERLIAENLSGLSYSKPIEA